MTSQASHATVEGVLEELGGCGRFQVLVVILIQGSTMAASWTALFLSFGGFNPGWTCLDPVAVNGLNVSRSTFDSLREANNTWKNESSCDLFDQCNEILFENDSFTIVTEWNLACGRNWIFSIIISVYMAGYLVGTISVGHFNHYFGRKVCQYVTMMMQCILNIVAIFSLNWPMYTVVSFFLGMTTGSIYVCAYVYAIEFLTSKWRGPFTALPATNTGYVLFAVAAMLLRDWKKLHIAMAVFSALWILPVFWVPESLRWLTIKGKSLKAREVGEKIAKVNNTEMPPADVIDLIGQEELKKKKEKVIYTVVDLYRHGYFTTTAILSFSWVCFAIVYYAIMYGVRNLSGDFYTNLMIFAFITTASYPFVPIFSNTIGRRWGTIIFVIVSVVCCVGLVCSHYVGDYVNEGLMVTFLSFILITCIDGAWAIGYLYSVELYPTPLRALSYSHGSCVSGLGGMIAPFLINDKQRSSMLLHLVMGIITLLTAIFIIFLPETKGQHMADSLKLSNTKDNAAEEETSVIV